MQRNHKIIGLILILCVCSWAITGYVIAATPSQITYLSPGSLTETVSYTIWIDGTTYYAKDGETGQILTSSTDIGALINTLKEELPTRGGTIFVKGADYKQSTTITIDNGDVDLTILGEAYKTTTVFQVQTDIYSINVTGYSTDVLVEHLRIAHIKIQPKAALTSTKPAIFLQYVGGSKFENLAIDNMGYGIYADTGETPNVITQCVFNTITIYEPEESGIVLQDSYDCRLYDIKVLDAQGDYIADSRAGIKLIHPYGGDVLDSCLVLNGLGHGIMVTENAHWTLLINCISDTNEGSSIVLTEAEGTQIVNCWGSSSQNIDTYGILIDRCNDTMISNSQFRTNGAHGIYVVDSSSTVITSSMSLTNGQESQGYGLSIVDSDNTIVSACTMANRWSGSYNVTAQIKGIDEDSDSSYTNIVGVDTIDNLSYGIIVAGADVHVNSSWNSTVWVD